MTNLRDPLHSLKQGTWFKLICGASFQDLPAIHNLSLVYSLAGVDCIDVAADPTVVEAARGGMAAAQVYLESARSRGLSPNPKPWLMVSLNDADDPHFRKAQFNPEHCPPDCPRPCEAVCPAAAIAFTQEHQGVIQERCYGCGRCLPICPQGLISAKAYRTSPETLAPFVLSMAVDAIEIHTQPGHQEDFEPCGGRSPLGEASSNNWPLVVYTVPTASTICDRSTTSSVAPFPNPSGKPTDAP